MVYVIADIHGELKQFEEILHQINLKENDILYILGDVLDRGSHPIRVLQMLMKMPNVVCLMGNHELMALPCLEYLCRRMIDDGADEGFEEVLEDFGIWSLNHCKTTMEEFCSRDHEEQQEIISYIKKMKLNDELSIGGQDYLLVHAGLGNFSPKKSLDEYTPEELVWERGDYSTEYYQDKYVIVGHTPTQVICGNPKPGYIYRIHHNICMDCGSSYPGGRLAAICLDTGEEFYSSTKKAE
jgi:serine/threonine protein phosphatase 1